MDQKMINLFDLFFQADDNINNKSYKEAHQILLKIIEEVPSFGRAYNHLGWLYSNKYRDYKVAEDYYLKALEYSPDYTATYKNYAILLSICGRYDELKAVLEKSLGIPGINKEKIYYEAAIMHEFQKNYIEAIHYLKKTIENSLNIKTIQLYCEDIERCEKKMEILGFQ